MTTRPLRPGSFVPVLTFLTFLTFLLLGAASPRARGESPTDTPSPPPPRTVVWISMDGVRSDYLERGKLPFFDRMRREGAWSRRLRPVFPPITFPSHCSQATGVTVERHGVTGNSFYDTGTRQESRYPAEAALLQAEPIWLTAAGQGVRTLVYDWPLSQNESGVVRAAYFGERFDNAPSDDQRLDHLLETWRGDGGAAGAKDGGPLPLRLLMAYVHATDGVGHTLGPDAPGITPAMEKLDASLARFLDAALERWRATNPHGEFILLLTTDHGMSRVDHLVSLEKALGLSRRLSSAGPPGPRDPVIVQVGNLGHLFVPSETTAPDARESLLAGWEEKLRAFPFLKVYRRENLPAAWGYQHPTRTGDLVVFCGRDYTFDASAPAAVVDTAPGKLHGMHGYAVEEDPEMFGPCFLWRSGGDHGGGRDLGEVRWDQLHPTVARLLGIKPASGATGRSLE